ncbi:flagellar biosynthesis anti-sigma factor FlgM [Trichlorobacter lovleyi]|uniref:Anti-sigma-28 factor, FlgM n=1 Tax=Trichlorobacter lovleyi (strain ATCC BAA-1151 / DSM 17278 / SZ) TaxID=398767 RepID=B3E2H3_TRIL1|nr:flagellar biosynthesis anti-sigma factor FlgM [Trichlorobacter lovleyi]ACD94226.1 anti-sigma-28 factor, FlgM [Trichlorobacter lovleyi SZ]
MRIDSATTAIFGAQPVMKTAKSEASRSVQSTAAVQSPFSVQLTNMVEKLSSVQPSSGEIRPEKVQDISQQLASGSYNISGQDVAEKMLMALTS